MDINIIKATLLNKLTSLQADVDAWEKIAKDSKNEDYSVFAKHQSQIIRLHELFTGIVDTLESEICYFKGGKAFEFTNDLNTKILQGHALWSYFRNKFFLRYSKNLQPYLSAADEFAWACFKPLSDARARARANEKTKDRRPPSKVPPLIYLGRDLSPFVFPREWSLEDQIPDVDDAIYRSLIEKAPFSVVSLPFYQTTHLPETMVLAHEMGHVVEMDLGLSEALDLELENLPENDLAEAQKKTWKRCRVEAFADVFGATVGGVAFCRTLANFLAKDRQFITTEGIGESKKYAYPTTYLRVLLVIEVLRKENPVEASVLKKEFVESYGEDHQYKNFEKDIKTIVKIFIDTEFDELNKQSIRNLVSLKKADNDAAANWAKKMLDKKIPQLNDPRVLLAAATLAFYSDPQGYNDKGVKDLVLNRIELVGDKTPRKRESVSGNIHLLDRQAGIALAGLLGLKTNPSEFSSH